MRYVGGKAKIAKELAAQIAPYRGGRIIWEPFCGGLGSAAAHGGTVICSDASLSLISMLKAFAGGWRPPESITREQRQAARDLPRTDPMHGFCEFALSFGGDSWAGFAQSDGRRNYQREAVHVLERDVPKVSAFTCEDFLEIPVDPTLAEDVMIYCDPPYQGRTGYRGPPFDHELFVATVQDWAEHVPVLVSEYSFPIGQEVWTRVRGANLKTKAGPGATHTERLYLINPDRWARS